MVTHSPSHADYAGRVVNMLDGGSWSSTAARRVNEQLLPSKEATNRGAGRCGEHMTVGVRALVKNKTYVHQHLGSASASLA